jgi:bifunctional DNA-binding transcriptional regulator/antitoxin component of YhaV-PrlF toxin-antitoxin module
MVAKLTLHRVGRIVLRKALRDELQLSPGDTLEVMGGTVHDALLARGHRCILLSGPGGGA